MFKALTAWLDAFMDASPGRKLLLTVLAVLPIAALIAAYLWLNQPPYRVLFSRLTDQSGGEVMAALEQLDIPHRLSATDGAIEVPANQLYAARFKLAARGLPKPDTQGYERTESGPSFGLSQFQEQMRYQHALETELVRSIETLDAVAAARVHLALPKVSPFLRDPPPVTAAVLVQFKPQKSLTADQVTAIQRMVAASVPRLKSEDVNVLDPQGRLLGTVSARIETRGGALEADLTRRAAEVFAAWLGADKAKVQVITTLGTDGRLRRLNAAVILPPGTSPEVVSKATTLARQALGFDAQRGDSLSVLALPATPLSSTLPQASPNVIPEKPVRATASAPEPVAQLPWVLAAAAVGGALLTWVLLRRRRPSGLAVDEDLVADSDNFDVLLQASRRQALDNPRVTADVIRMWMRA